VDAGHINLVFFALLFPAGLAAHLQPPSHIHRLAEIFLPSCRSFAHWTSTTLVAFVVDGFLIYHCEFCFALGRHHFFLLLERLGILKHFVHSFDGAAAFLDLLERLLGEELVDRQLQHVLDHARQIALQQLGGLLEAGIRVHFDEPLVEVLVKNEVVTEQFKAVLALEGVELLAHRVEGLHDDLLHLRHEVVLDADVLVRVVLVDVLLELREAQLVAVLELAVGLTFHLHRVVGQVHEGIVHVLQIYAIVTARSPQVALREEVQIRVMREDDPDPDVELTFTDEERPLNVLLDNERVKLYFIL